MGARAGRNTGGRKTSVIAVDNQTNQRVAIYNIEHFYQGHKRRVQINGRAVYVYEENLHHGREKNLVRHGTFVHTAHGTSSPLWVPFSIGNG